jgi:hypothetical protein
MSCDPTRRRSTLSSLKGHQRTDRRHTYRIRQHGARCGAVCVWREWSRPHVWGHRDWPGPCSDGDESATTVSIRPDDACSMLSRLARPCAEPGRQQSAPCPAVHGTKPGDGSCGGVGHCCPSVNHSIPFAARRRRQWALLRSSLPRASPEARTG